MNVKFLNPFVEAAAEVLQAETGLVVKRGDLGLDKGAYITDDVTVIIAMVGQIQGNVFYSMNSQAGIMLASEMISEKLEAFDSLAQSGIAELGNVITGRASVKLASAGFETNISPPTLLIGRGATISTLDFPRLTVPLMVQDQAVTIHLALREGKSTQSAAQMQVPKKPL